MNHAYLKEKMKEKHISNGQLASFLNIDPATLWRKRKGHSDFTRRELLTIRQVLYLSDEDLLKIFFDESETPATETE